MRHGIDSTDPVYETLERFSFRIDLLVLPPNERLGLGERAEDVPLQRLDE
jgi:hypothetical protein